MGLDWLSLGGAVRGDVTRRDDTVQDISTMDRKWRNGATSYGP
jgi:hypothetical protein